MTEAFAEDRPPADLTMVRLADIPTRFPGVSRDTAKKWSSRGVKIDGQLRKLGARALDAQGQPLFFVVDVQTFVDHRARTAATRVSSCVQLAPLAPSTPAPVSLDPGASSCLEGFSVAEPPAETRRIRLLMCPELDPEAVAAFKAQVAQLAAETTSQIANALSAGLQMQGVTIHMNGPTQPPA